ncbi:OsmC family protein [Neobacillus sp. PS3-40]|uniref:OsmC family protein n=1 Tax=Neobacillus sp. PS3-40 TaxID=3070679 RepID=UPI0027E00B4B|nr:OsmC family protein [Neobacillus sp. PS3-40]WML44246.1 OsmC family protein [Neobacillus sp. PS3-40]
MENFRFSINGTWQGDRNGTGHIRSKGGLDIEVSVPKEFDGPGIGSSPEELLISSSNNCYMITLAAMLSKRNIDVDKLEVVSEGVVESEDGKLNFKQIIHRPIFYVGKETDITSDKLKDIAVRAEKACFISQTLRCSIDFSVEPEVVLQ